VRDLVTHDPSLITFLSFPIQRFNSPLDEVAVADASTNHKGESHS
jgi:hypothetical protein